ncbi:unnamed protein product [Pleuronectes platessa]|uniref:Uncharacterized protein n=1 Tax=Pleuronectes platessa TaxID=8262 RepID=A0A9N7YGU8_PLEPL|nr:unnamed protein product [Pleuronectes platessa]
MSNHKDLGKSFASGHGLHGGAVTPQRRSRVTEEEQRNRGGAESQRRSRVTEEEQSHRGGAESQRRSRVTEEEQAFSELILSQTRIRCKAAEPEEEEDEEETEEEGRSQVAPRHDGISAGGYRAIAAALDGAVQV